jgi:hypothetical protein
MTLLWEENQNTFVGLTEKNSNSANGLAEPDLKFNFKYKVKFSKIIAND